MWKCARFPFLSITVGRGKVASRHRRSQMASKSRAGGRNTALYQRFWCLPTHRQRKRRQHKHACGASTCRWLGSPLRAFLFRQRQCEPEETQRSDCAPGCAGSSAVRQLYWECFVLFVVEEEGGGSNFRCIQYIWKRMEKASASGFANRIVSQRGCGCDTRRETALPFCLEQRKRTFKVFSGLGQLSMRVLLKHLTPLCIQCHINLAPWPPRQLWCEPSGQAALLGARLQMTGSSHQRQFRPDLKSSHDDIILILDIIMTPLRSNLYFL